GARPCNRRRGKRSPRRDEVCARRARRDGKRARPWPVARGRRGSSRARAGRDQRGERARQGGSSSYVFHTTRDRRRSGRTATAPQRRRLLFGWAARPQAALGPNVEGPRGFFRPVTSRERTRAKICPGKSTGTRIFFL